MKKYPLKHIVTLGAIIATGLVTGQETTEQEKEERRLNGGSITVVKPYDPTISDAFKVKSNPDIESTTQVQKKPVSYAINSVPVASTFTPVTGKLNRLKPKKREQYYKNYARLGVGNYLNVLGEFATNFEISRNQHFNVFFNHFSSQGGINDVKVDDGFSNTGLDLSYKATERDYQWTVNAGGNYQTANWYGIHPDFTALVSEDIDIATNFLHYNVGGSIDFTESVFKGVDLQMRGVQSAFDASELRVTALPEFAFEVMDTEVALGLTMDYLNGSMDNTNFPLVAEAYSFLDAGINPSINIYGDNYKAELGTRIHYVSDLENSVAKLRIYPDINASYLIAEEQLMAFTDIGGGLDMNTLGQVSEDNVFIAPAVNISPTHRQLDAKLGLKGTLYSFGYRIYGGYRLEENRFFYTSNTPDISAIARENFEWGNTFDLNYGDLNTFLYGASLSYDFSQHIDVLLQFEGMSYSVDNGDAFNNIASHLPTIKVDMVSNIQINEKWYAGVGLYYIGEREAYRAADVVDTLDGFVDLNLDVNYKINPQLTAFLRGYNLTGGNYQVFNAYPVQNLQIMGGAVYKFDF